MRPSLSPPPSSSSSCLLLPLLVLLLSLSASPAMAATTFTLHAKPLSPPMTSGQRPAPPRFLAEGVMSSLAGKDQAFIEPIQMLSPLRLAYFATIEFTGGQTVDMLVDTGSAGMGVPINNTFPDWQGFQYVDTAKAGGHVISCDDPRCRGSCHGPSTQLEQCGPHGGSCMRLDGGDLACSFLWRFGDGSHALGVLMESYVDLGGAGFNATYGGVMQADRHFFESPKGGGILGLSFTNDEVLCAPPYTCFTSTLDEIRGQKEEEMEDRFALCGYGDTGVLVLGGGDPTLYQAPLQSVPLVGPHAWYQVNVHRVHLGKEEISANIYPHKLRGKAAPNSTAPFVAILDTGNVFFHLSDAVFDKFRYALEDSMKALLPPDIPLRSVLDGYSFRVADDVLSQLPELVLTLDSNLTLSYSPLDYLREFVDHSTATPDKVRALAVGGGSMFILGMPATNRLYLEVDRRSKTLGIARANPGCERLPSNNAW